MATAVLDIAVRMKAEILGPESPFEIGRIALKGSYKQTLEEAKKIVVTDHATEASAIEAGRVLQAATAEIATFYKPYKQEIDKVKKVVLDAEHVDDDEVEAEKARLSKSINKFRAEQAEIQREQDRINREAAEKQAQEEQLARAIELEAEGNTAEAARVLEEAPMPMPVIQQKSTASHVPGYVNRNKWKARLVGSDDADPDKADQNAKKSLFAVIKQVANGQAPIEYLMLNESFANNQGNQFRKGLNVAGLEAYEVKSSGFRS